MAYLSNIKCKLEQVLLLKCILVDLKVALERAMLHKLHHKTDLWILDHTFDLHNIWMLQSLDKSIRNYKSIIIQLLHIPFLNTELG